MMARHLLLVDLSNVLFICGFRLEKQSELMDIEASLFRNTEEYIRQLTRQLNISQVIFACDSTEKYWRESLYPLYKAHREETGLKKIVRQVQCRFKIKYAKQCVELSGCEADDVIFVAATSLKGLMTIVSTDRDFIQLISHRVKLYNPTASHHRYPEEDKEYLLFEKCFRGDRGDNIPSAYPKISKKALKAAYQDGRKLERLLVVKHERAGLVKTQYDLNRQLIDLNKIPREYQLGIRKKIREWAVQEGLE